MRSGAAILMIAAMTFLLPTGAWAIPIAHLTLDSEPGDYIGQGGHFDLFYDSKTDFVGANVLISAFDKPPVALQWFVDSPIGGTQSASLEFGTSGLLPIQPGVYLGAQRFGLGPGPGLDISFLDRGSNTLTGNFTIFELQFTDAPPVYQQVIAFKVAFEQHSDGAQPALFGTFEYNIHGVPEPDTLGLGLLGSLGIALQLCRRRYRHKTHLHSAREARPVLFAKRGRIDRRLIWLRF